MLTMTTASVIPMIGAEYVAKSGTGWKPENKLFYTPDLRWWGVFGCADPACGAANGGVYRGVGRRGACISDDHSL